ncbi:MAG: sigma-70 family RNA polymerase sigma factor [Victivallaceae bacterium]|nr:sigma-70 family RNA polymerase sigma factor [Victivallaceae bacterium]
MATEKKTGKVSSVKVNKPVVKKPAPKPVAPVKKAVEVKKPAAGTTIAKKPVAKPVVPAKKIEDKPVVKAVVAKKPVAPVKLVATAKKPAAKPAVPGKKVVEAKKAVAKAPIEKKPVAKPVVPAKKVEAKPVAKKPVAPAKVVAMAKKPAAKPAVPEKKVVEAKKPVAKAAAANKSVAPVKAVPETKKPVAPEKKAPEVKTEIKLVAKPAEAKKPVSAVKSADVKKNVAPAEAEDLTNGKISEDKKEKVSQRGKLAIKIRVGSESLKFAPRSPAQATPPPVEVEVPVVPDAQGVSMPVMRNTKAAKDAERKKRLSDRTNTDSKTDSMKHYMYEIGRYSLITKEEEIELAAQIHGDDPDLSKRARSTMIKANLRLVVKIAHDFKGLGLPLQDLICEGNIGLMRAVDKFDPTKGAKFSSYAAWWIKQSMRRAIANQSRTIRIPVQSAAKITKIKMAKVRLCEMLGREPSDAEIAEETGFSERTVSGLRLADLHTISLNDPIQQGEEGEFQDIIPDPQAKTPEQIVSEQEMKDRLHAQLERLDERERKIIEMRFGLKGGRALTLEEVSQEIGRTRERVRQIQNQAIAKLKRFLTEP